MRTKQALFKFIMVCLGLALAVLFTEGILRFGKDFLPRDLQNILMSKYNRRPDGIYYKNEKWQVNIIKPNSRQEIVYNGHRWLQQSNEIGIRSNRNIEHADIVALGDSFVYGHGVQIEDTLCHHLETISKKRVANLGVQGDYPISEYIRLKNLALFLKPEIVLFFLNISQDCSDFLIFRPTLKYIDSIISLPPPDYSQGVLNSSFIRGYSSHKTRLIDYFSQWSFSARIAIELLRSYWADFQSRRNRNSTNKDDISIIHNSLKRILSSSLSLCKQNNARLVVIFQANSPSDKSKWDKFLAKCIPGEADFKEMSKEICTGLGIPFIDLQNRSPRDRYFLPSDNHYSPEGNKWAARCIYEALTN